MSATHLLKMVASKLQMNIELQEKDKKRDESRKPYEFSGRSFSSMFSPSNIMQILSRLPPHSAHWGESTFSTI
jgi:hypothetical protein